MNKNWGSISEPFHLTLKAGTVIESDFDYDLFKLQPGQYCEDKAPMRAVRRFVSDQHFFW